MDRLIQYIGNHPLLAGAAVVVAIAAIVMEFARAPASFAAIGPQDAIRLMNQNALVLDLRPAEAFAAGHLTGARNLPPDQILKAGETLKKYKEKPVVVYCDTGSLAAPRRASSPRRGSPRREPARRARGVARGEPAVTRRLICHAARGRDVLRPAGAVTARGRGAAEAKNVTFEEIDVDARPERAPR